MARSKAQARRMAIGAARSEIRRQRQQPQFFTPTAALLVLDDLYRNEPDLIASQWYSKATEAQIGLFFKEWQKWCADTIAATYEPVDDQDYRLAKE